MYHALASLWFPRLLTRVLLLISAILLSPAACVFQDQSFSERSYREWTKQFDVMFNKQLRARAQENASKVARGKDSMSFSARVGASIMSGGGAADEHKVDGSQSDRSHMKHAEHGDSNAARHGSSSSLQQDAHFLESLVSEMKKQLHHTSTTAAERLNEIIKLKQDLQVQTQANSDAQGREQQLLARLHRVNTEKQAQQRELLQLTTLYHRAECIAAHLEEQLRSCVNELNMLYAKAVQQEQAAMAAGEQKQSEPVKKYKQVDYAYLPDVEPSPLLRAALNSNQAASLHAASLSTLQTDTGDDSEALNGRVIQPFAERATDSTSSSQSALRLAGRRARVGMKSMLSSSASEALTSRRTGAASLAASNLDTRRSADNIHSS